MKPVHGKSNTNNGSSKEITNKDHKFKIGDIVGILNYKDILATVYTPKWSEIV